MKTKSNIVQSIAAMSFIAVQTSLHADDQTWIDANANNNWNTATDLNWDAGVAWTQGNNAIFGGTGEAVMLATGITFGNMTFNVAGYQISDNTLTLGATATITANADATIASAISSTGAQTLIKEGTGTLTLTGQNPLGGTSEGASNMVTINAGTLKIANGGKIGTALNTATCRVFVNTGGTLDIEAHAFGANLGYMNFNAANITLDGGTFKYSGADNVAETNNARGFMIGANGGTLSSAATSGGTWRLPNGGITSSSGGTLTLDGASNGRLDSALGGTGGLTKNGAGTWILTNGSSYTGATTVNQGKLILARGDNAGQVIATASAIAIHNTGTVEVGSDNNINSNAFTVNAGSTLNMAAGKTAWLQGSLTLAGGTLASTDGGFNGTETFILNPTGGTVTVNGNTTSTISAQNVLLGNNSTLTFNVADGTAAVDLNVTGNLKNNGTSGLNKSGTGTMVLAGSNSYSGATTVSAGTLLVSGALGNTAVSVAANATLGGTGSIVGSLGFDGNSFLTITDLNDALAVTGTITFGAGFGIDNLTGLDWDSLALNTPYTVLATTQTFTSANIENFGLANAVAVGGSGRSAYFQNGSLQLVVIPEPRAALLGGLGMLALLRRRRG